MKLKIKKGDTVQIIAGQQKGTKGAVLAINPEKMKIKVQGVRVQTNFDKKEGIFKAEGFIAYSNVKLVESAAKEAKKAKKAKASSARK
jgi:large subunit ribosomal protein L24